MRLPIGIGDYVIRDWAMSDTDALVKHADNHNVWRNLLDAFPHPYSRRDAREWLHLATDQQPRVSFAIASPDEAIGGIGLQLQHDVSSRSAEVGYWLGEPFWGKGIATAAVRAFTYWAFAHRELQIERLFANAFAWNPASARVLEKAGYTWEGTLRRHVYKDGEFTDLLVYGLLRDDL
ncbi:MAG: GNAT family protein [Dehalococcoidia bacterium]